MEEFHVDDLAGSEGVLVEQNAQRAVQFWHLFFKCMGLFKKSLDAHGPEFLVVGGGIGVQYRYFAGLHLLEHRAGHFGKVLELIMKAVVLPFFNGEIDIDERMGHFMQSDVLPICIIREFPDKIVPGKIDATQTGNSPAVYRWS